ncbi:MAG: type I DNA topoisomerase [Rhodospirillaceae bacterium]|nr:type I DNA topoisomerase [Rhodospirillaceae bacterium]
MQVVIVESPAKAKTINKYLGADYKVIASYGHIRDLPPKDGSVRPDENFAMDWEVDSGSQKHLKEIISSLKGADGLILATDPDREGEAISWHVLDELRSHKALDGKKVKRVTFNAITKNAVLDAMANPRDLDIPLVDAYLARRALDYLVGFTLSPVLWRKLPGSKSAGRVQSVALRMICDRELEIEKFKAEEYWTVGAEMATQAKEGFGARLTHFEGKKLDKFDLNDEAKATRAAAAVRSGSFTVTAVEKKTKQRRPYAPFTTSTLQQDASRRLYFSARQTMDLAQKLYEGVEIDGETTGLITYMRTDGVQMDQDAIHAVRGLVADRYGKKYVPEQFRIYKSKAKNAQEAHEAIRPTDIRRTPEIVAKYVSADQLKLYELIWKRTMASQMESAIVDGVSVTASTPDGRTQVRANGSTIVFKGYLEVYDDTPAPTSKESVAKEAKKDDGKDPTGDEEDESLGRLLPAMTEGQKLDVVSVLPEQHFTQPPPRFSEASLVKALEEKGIGRPSTYASIIQVLQDRKYVRMDGRRFIPEDRGRVVIAFLESFFLRYVEYNFTADLENQLDEISSGNLDWKQVLADFWRDFAAAIDGTKDLTRTAVIDALDELLEPHLFPVRADGTNPRVCPACTDGRIGLKFGKFGSFIGCSRYPECRYTRPLGTPDGANGQFVLDGPKDLGADPVSGLKVTLRVGPYGPYVQLGGEEVAPAPPAPKVEADAGEVDPKAKKKKKKAAPKDKPKRMSLPKGTDPNDVDLAKALKLLALPREIGPDPETGDMILAGIGRFGPYLKVGSRYQSLPKDDDVLEIGLNRAVVVLIEGKERQGKRAGGGSAKTLGEHPEDKKPVTLRSGRFGPYVQHGQLRATLTRDLEPDTVTLDAAVALLAAKAAKGAAPAKGKKAAAEAAPPAPKAKKSTSAKAVKSPKAKTDPAVKTPKPKAGARVPRKAAE